MDEKTRTIQVVSEVRRILDEDGLTPYREAHLFLQVYKCINWRTGKQFTVKEAAEELGVNYGRFRNSLMLVMPIVPASLTDEDRKRLIEAPANRGNTFTSFLRRSHMSRTAVAQAQNEVVQQACSDASAVQDAVNLIAIVGSFHRRLLALRDVGVFGDDLNNHPVSLAFVSKLNSLCRMSLDREIKAFEALDRLQRGEDAEFEVIPL